MDRASTGYCGGGIGGTLKAEAISAFSGGRHESEILNIGRVACVRRVVDGSDSGAGSGQSNTANGVANAANRDAAARYSQSHTTNRNANAANGNTHPADRDAGDDTAGNNAERDDPFAGTVAAEQYDSVADAGK